MNPEWGRVLEQVVLMSAFLGAHPPGVLGTSKIVPNNFVGTFDETKVPRLAGRNPHQNKAVPQAHPIT